MGSMCTNMKMDLQKSISYESDGLAFTKVYFLNILVYCFLFVALFLIRLPDLLKPCWFGGTLPVLMRAYFAKQVIGEWSEVASTCRRGHLQPQVLFYEAEAVLAF